MPRPLILNLNLLPKTAETVLKLGRGYFFPGTPCKWGHVSAWYLYICKGIIIRRCTECQRKHQSVLNALLAEDLEIQAQKSRNTAAYRKKYPWKVNEYKQRRQLHIKQATPGWACRETILSIYRQAHELTLKTGVLYSVDHIIPLKGKLVCGLHVEQNLRVIPMADNRVKGNKVMALDSTILTMVE